MDSTVIEFNQVSKVFDGHIQAVREVDVIFKRGRITALIGPSGAGKSTLLRLINGLYQPTNGSIETLGVRVDTAREEQLRGLRREVAMIFQHFNLVGQMSALENVCSGRLGSLRWPRVGLMMYRREIRETAMAQLARVGLSDKAFQRTDTLSGGQQQRVAIARALIQEPKILLADEPVAALDPLAAAEVVNLLRTITAEDGLSVIASLHQLPTALSLADRVIGMNSGRIVMDAEAENLSDQEALRIYQPIEVDAADQINESQLAGLPTKTGAAPPADPPAHPEIPAAIDSEAELITPNHPDYPDALTGPRHDP